MFVTKVQPKREFDDVRKTTVFYGDSELFNNNLDGRYWKIVVCACVFASMSKSG